MKTRMNPFCVISIDTFGEYAMHDIQTNSAWNSNPYGNDYAVVPDELVKGIIGTRGFCDIIVEDGIVTTFTAREIPAIPEPAPEPTIEDKVAELEEQLMVADEVAVSLYEQQLAQEEINIAQDEALCELYEMMEV